MEHVPWPCSVVPQLLTAVKSPVAATAMPVKS